MLIELACDQSRIPYQLIKRENISVAIPKYGYQKATIQCPMCDGTFECIINSKARRLMGWAIIAVLAALWVVAQIYLWLFATLGVVSITMIALISFAVAVVASYLLGIRRMTYLMYDIDGSRHRA